MNIQDIVEDSGLSRNTKSNVLSRALKQAYARYPSAKNDTEAFAAWAMDRQNNADDLIDKQADLNRRQDAVIKAIDQDNADQEKHIQALDQENDQLAAELGKVGQRPSSTPDAAAPAPAKPAAPADKKDSNGTVAIPTPFAPASASSTEKTKNTTGAKAFSAMVPQLGNPQQSLPFDQPSKSLAYQPSDNIYMPTNAKTASRFKPGDNVTDIEAKRFSKIAKDVAANPEKFKAAHGVGESIERLRHLAGTGKNK